MCTVTFLPTSNGAILTSSRDEHINRGPAIPPQIYHNNGNTFIYPTDRKAGGSWFVINSSGTTAVLLNGAFGKHEVKDSYRMSRGLLLLRLFEEQLIHRAIQERLLFNIEPFTLILWEENVLYEYRWDGDLLFQKVMDSNQNHIWSSSTLYNLPMRQERQLWFNKWLERNATHTIEDALYFHRHTHSFNKDYGICMNRLNGIRTMSITSAHIMPENIRMHHLDLINAVEHYVEAVIPFSSISDNTSNQHVEMAQAN
jgi:hypothetical protein